MQNEKSVALLVTALDINADSNLEVKCDEQRPTCAQCARLGHDCDYNPRLAFRDDTPRVMERVQNITTAGSSVWNPHLPTPGYGPDRSGQDLLPAFSSLTTDGDRERKAELQEPGTYLVIANPSSFARLPEYIEEDESNRSSTAAAASPGAQLHGGPSNGSSIHSTIDESTDPNIVILKTFEDLVRRSPVLSFSNSDAFPLIPPSQPPTVLRSCRDSIPFSLRSGHSSLSKLDKARGGGRDAHLLEHYRSHISKHVIQVGSPSVGEDAFEIQARTFPPLFHAMMAISALSIAHRSGTPTPEALEHYQQVLPAMRDFIRSEEDSNSDGALFTHYLLLLYEIASAGPWESNMWHSHSRTLLKIIARRRQINLEEPHGFLVLVICLVDTYAMLSGSGNGAFVDFILKNDMLAPQDCLPPLAPGHPQSFFHEELEYFPGLLELYLQVVSLAVTVGEAARNLRAEDAQQHLHSVDALNPTSPYITGRRSRAYEIQALCRRLASEWEAGYPQHWSWQPATKALPRRVRGFHDHIYTLYRACVIYSHTSMYSGQMAEEKVGEDFDDDVPSRVTEIFELAQQIVRDERWELQFLPFSLFLAGIVSTVKEEKLLALKLMAAFERQSYGGNTATMRRLLQAVYDKQQVTADNCEQILRIDWVEEMKLSGLRLVMFGQGSSVQAYAIVLNCRQPE